MEYLFFVIVVVAGYQLYKKSKKSRKPKKSTFEIFHVNPIREEPTGVTLHRFIDEWNRLGTLKNGPTRDSSCLALKKNSRTKLFTLSGKIVSLSYSHNTWHVGLTFDLPILPNSEEGRLAAYIIAEEYIPTCEVNGKEVKEYYFEPEDDIFRIMLNNKFKDNEGAEFMRYLETCEVGDAINLLGYPVVPRDDVRNSVPIEFHIRSFEMRDKSWEYIGDESMGKWQKIA